MKTSIYSFLISIIILINIGCAHAQNNTDNNQAIHMLKEFYTAYITAWSTRVAPNIHDQKLYSLQSRYCTIRFRKELKESGLEHDPLINDEYTDVEHLKTLSVKKNPNIANNYIISYIDHTVDNSNKPIDKMVTIYVTVEKEKGIFKIANAYGDAVRGY